MEGTGLDAAAAANGVGLPLELLGCVALALLGNIEPRGGQLGEAAMVVMVHLCERGRVRQI